MVLLLFGVIFLILDRVFDKKKVAVQRERLSFFINFYHPWVERRHFLGSLLLIVLFSAAVDYLLYNRIDLKNYLIILVILFGGLYMAIFFLAVFELMSIPKSDFRLNFLRWERELIQQFALGLCQPVFALGYLLRTFLGLWMYPEKGILVFKSISGMVGFLLIIIGTIVYYI